MCSPSIARETLGFSSELANDSSQRCTLAQRQWPKYKERQRMVVEVSKVSLQYKHFEGLRRFCKSGWLLEALWTADVLYQQGIALSVDLLYRLLQLSIDKQDLAAGTKVHGLVKRSGLYGNAFLSSHLIRMFSVCGSLWDANQVFQELAEPTVFTWSAAITAHAMHGYSEHAIELYHQMQQSGIKPDEHVFVAVLKACASIAAEKEGKQIHMHIKESGFGFDNFVGSTLISMYVKCGNLVDAHRVFEQLPDKNLVTWNSILTGYAQDKHGHEAFRLFQHLQQEGMQPDSVTFVSILKACSSIEALNRGKVMHMYAIEIGLVYDLFVCCALIDMYAKCGNLEIAHTLFSNLSKRNVVVWNALITGYSQHGCNQEAFQLFNSMQQEGMQPDSVTFSGILKACASIEGLHQGKLIHVLLNESGYKVDTVVCNALIGMYAKCGSLKSSLWEFNKLVNKNLVSWNTIIAAYAEHGHGQETLLLLQQMEQQGVEPDSVTFLSILKVCSSKTSVGLGKLIHSLVARSGLHLDLSVCNALIHMYANYASIRDARSVFESMPQLNRVTWNVMLAAYAQTGYSQEALQLYLLMHQEGTIPDGVTCVSILRACTTITAIGHGKLIHSFIIERGFDSDKFVGSTLIDLYLKCGSFPDANKLFDKWLKQDLVAWNAMIAGHAYYGLYKLALQYFEDMQHKGVKPDNVTFVCVLSACSQVGIAEQGRQYFDMLIDNRSVSPRAEHYHCIADLLGRAGCLHEAVDLLQTMPSFRPQILAWKSLLSHCRTHGNIHLGRKCFAHVIKKNCKDAAGYMLTSSIYLDLGMLKNVQCRRAEEI